MSYSGCHREVSNEGCLLGSKIGSRSEVGYPRWNVTYLGSRIAASMFRRQYCSFRRLYLPKGALNLWSRIESCKYQFSGRLAPRSLLSYEMWRVLVPPELLATLRLLFWCGISFILMLVARELPNLREIACISKTIPLFLSLTFAVDYHGSQVCICEFSCICKAFHKGRRLTHNCSPESSTHIRYPVNHRNTLTYAIKALGNFPIFIWCRLELLRSPDCLLVTLWVRGIFYRSTWCIPSGIKNGTDI